LLKKNCSSPFVNFPSHCNRQLVRELGSTFSALARVSQLLSFAPSSTAAFLALLLCFALVCAFEFANGFHDTANAVATVIYTNALKARVAVVWSALMNFLGVLLGGIAVAYALVELLPPDVLSPQNGSPAVPMLVALFTTALAWNLFTWWFAIPNSSSHCVVGSLIGIAVGDALIDARHIREAVDWGQVWSVLRALAISPILGFAGAGLLYFALRHIAKDRHLYEPPQGERPPTLWVRCLLILTCTSVSFSHGTNDGQKSIGLIVLTIIGLMPAAFALNPQADAAVRQLAYNAGSAAPLIAKYGDDQKQIALQSVQRLEQAGAVLTSAGAAAGPNDRSGRSSMPPDPAPSPQQSDPGAGRQEGPAAM
jgi:inorganic phosphate transporter, PiT family